MNRFIPVVGFLVVLLSLAACRNEPKPEQSDPGSVAQEQTLPKVPDDGGPADVQAISRYVETINIGLSNMEKRGPRAVSFGENMAEATAYADSTGTPVMIYCQLREVEQWYYLYNRRISQYRERRPGKKGFEERRWYYSQEKILAGELRIAPSPDALSNANPKALAPKDATAAESLNAINMTVFEILFGKIPQ